MKPIWIITILFLIFTAGCTTPQLAPIPTQPATPVGQDTFALQSVSQEQTNTETPIRTDTAAAGPTESPTPEPTATPDLRLPPEEWKKWPIVPEPSARVKEIYQRGIELGKDPQHFSKIGDCHNVRAAFLGFFDKPGWYVLRGQNAHLQPAIDWFAGSFDRDGYAVQGGYNAAAVISPIWANQEICESGENPVQCELRIHNPSFAFVSLELWWKGRTTERYEIYMRQILDTLIEQGVVPILATKADNVEGDNSLNYTTARLAYEYDLPLWNFWLAAQSLPHKGMDIERNDGFHISTLAWTERSFTALRTLEHLWQSVQEE
ncbi:MAG: hypothetical protein Q7U53_01985 [Anaerolineaceae bacterium]|nr:hypothetical protein [Anaerolineaceae bacterium]